MVVLTNARDIGCCDVVMWWHLMASDENDSKKGNLTWDIFECTFLLSLLFIFIFFFCSVLFCLVLFWVFFYFLLFSILFFFFLRVSSVNPGNRDPLRTGRQSLHGLFQSSNRFFNVVVYNGQVEKRTIRRFQQIWLFYQTLQTSVVLKKQFNFDSVNWSKFFR